MKDKNKTGEQLINELVVLRQRITELETSEIQHKRVEEMLRQSEEKHRETCDLLPQPVCETDERGNLILANRSAFNSFGYTGEDFDKGLNVLQMFVPEDLDRASENIRRVLGGEKLEGIEYTALRKDGSAFPIVIYASPIIREGRPIGMSAVIADVTERKQAEERERQLHQELNLASRLACVGELASGVAHEINNPLTAVLGFSQMLAGRDVPEEMKEKLEIISDNAQRVAKIVRNLLTFARQHKAGRTYADINSIISRLLDMRAYEMRVHSIKVTTRLAPDLPWTMADVGQLQQVFLDIILNAEQAMGKAHNEGNLVIKTGQKNNSIRISFKDDGPGIASENLDKIFDPFFTTKAVNEGTGLGLSVSYGIIKEHKGKIYAESKLGKGATFIIELPVVAEVQQLESDETAVEEPGRVTGARIMVVDDEPAICQFLSQVLTQEGHNVETIDNASAALERLKCERYSLILLDIRMKGMDGIELYRHIGEIASSLQRRVIFITGDTMTSTTRSFLDRTKARCIAKPFDTEQLKEEINQILIEGM